MSVSFGLIVAIVGYFGSIWFHFLGRSISVDNGNGVIDTA